MTTLSNPGLDTLLLEALADNTLSYQELLSLLQTAALQGLTESELLDLQAVYIDQTLLFGTEVNRDYLKSIYYNVVFGNPGNETWWGGENAEPLGNLQNGSTEQSLLRLIDKWFLGQDLPLPSSNEGQSAHGNASVRYQTAEGDLFVDGVSEEDIVQGQALTCYLLSALGSIAKAQSQYITSSFIDNGNGTYGVRLYIEGRPIYTTVDLSLPVQKNGKLVFASDDENRTLDGELWVSLLEKAYAQFNAQFDTRAFSALEYGLVQLHDAIDTSTPLLTWSKENSYTAIGRSYAQAIKQFTNLNYRYYSSFLKDGGFNSENDIGVLYSPDPVIYKQTLIDALNGGAIGWLASYGSTTSGSNFKFNFLPGHAYMLLGYNSATDKFMIRNPWGGAAQVTPYNEEFEVSIDAFWNQNVKSVVALSDANLKDPEFSYTLTQASESVSEGQIASFTVTRNTSGLPSTVYLSTAPGDADGNAANAADFLGLDKLALKFAKDETTKLVTVETYADTHVESTESFLLNLYTAYDQLTPVKTATATIQNTLIDKNYAYSLAALTTMAEEGNALEFLITRSDSGSSSTVYLSTRHITTDSQDFQGFGKAVLRFEEFETEKIVTLPILSDGINEIDESLGLQLFINIDDATPTDESSATIADRYVPTYNYLILSSAASAATAANENGEVTFTIMRSGSGSASTVYLSTRAATADPSDYDAIYKQAVVFAPDQQKATVTVKLAQDWLLEEDEFFSLELYPTLTDTIYASSAPAFIRGVREEDVIQDAQGNLSLQLDDKLYNYAVTIDADEAVQGKTSSSADGQSNGLASNSLDLFAINEGGEISVTITRSDSGTPSSVYLNTSNSGTSLGDYAGLAGLRVDFEAYELTKTINIKTFNDNESETNERFTLNLFRNATDKSPATSRIVDIQNVDLKMDYAFDVPETASEGQVLPITIRRSGDIASASTVFLHAIGRADENDYEKPFFTELSFQPQQTEISLSLPLYTDNLNEKSENIVLLLFDSYADALAHQVRQHARIKLEDATATVEYDYSFSGTRNLVEGQPLSVTLTRSGSGTESRVLIELQGTVDARDFDAPKKQRKFVDFKADETEKTITLDTYQDRLKEGSEYLKANLYKTVQSFNNYQPDAQFQIVLRDSEALSYRYELSSGTTSVQEGESVLYTITRSGKGDASTVFLSTKGSVDGSDLDLLDKFPVTFAADETIKTLTIPTRRDINLEGDELLTLVLYDSYGDAVNNQWSDYDSQSVRDWSGYQYTVTSNSPVNEGQSFSMTITRDSTGIASEVTVKPVVGTADANDFDVIAASNKLIFAADESSKTLIFNTVQDVLVEGTETVALKLTAPNFDTTVPLAILDDDNFSYTVATNSPVTEGQSFSLTITRDSTGIASEVTVKPVFATADAKDFDLLFISNTVKFTATETSKTLTFNTVEDVLVEGNEVVALNLTAPNFDTTVPLTILDNDNFNYTITSNSPVTEGQSFSLTIIRDSTGIASELTVKPIFGTASLRDFDLNTVSNTVKFTAAETRKILTFNTVNDSLIESNETLALNFTAPNFDTTVPLTILDNDFLF